MSRKRLSPDFHDRESGFKLLVHFAARILEEHFKGYLLKMTSQENQLTFHIFLNLPSTIAQVSMQRAQFNVDKAVRANMIFLLPFALLVSLLRSFSPFQCYGPVILHKHKDRRFKYFLKFQQETTEIFFFLKNLMKFERLWPLLA